MKSRNTYLVVQRALRSQLSEVKLNSAWRKVHDFLSVGRLVAGKLHLTNKDREVIREWFMTSLGADPLFDDLDGDRVDVAAKSNEEKLSNEKVFEGLIKVSSAKGKIPLKKGDGVTPWHTILEIEPSHICWDKVENIVIVENGYAIRHWHDFNIPSCLEHSLAIFRGYNNDAKLVSDLIKNIPSKTKIFAFYDFDPSGMNMVTMYSYHGVLLPETLNDELTNIKNSNPVNFHDQISVVGDISKSLPSNCLGHWYWMQENKVALMQEKMLALNTKLNVFNSN